MGLDIYALGNSANTVHDISQLGGRAGFCGIVPMKRPRRICQLMSIHYSAEKSRGPRRQKRLPAHQINLYLYPACFLWIEK